MQHTLKVAIQGDQASFHEIAATNYYAHPIELIYCHTFEDAFIALHTKEVDTAFVAVKNSSHGEIKETAALLRKYPVVIDGSYTLAIEQHLIGVPSASVSSVRNVTSHPVALSQCDEFLSRFNKSEYYDTSAAVSYVKASNDPTLAAVGSEAAANLYGLKVLKRNIHNDPDNCTTFASVRNMVL